MKRKRQQQQQQQRGGSALEDEARDYFNRLLHKCRKDVHKQVKVVRNFECQKVSRKLKESSSSSSSAQKSSSDVLSQRLDRLKKLSLEVVVEETLRRLGILQLQPPSPLQEGVTIKENGVSTPSEKETSSTSEETKEFTEKILKHKRMQDAIEKWSGEVAEFRRWHVRQEEKQHARESGKSKHEKKKNNEKRASSSSSAADNKVADDDYSKSIFLKLGNQSDDEPDGDSQDDEDDDDIDDVLNPKHKKNRPGQRARKAKAMAVKAKKEGRKWDSSLNWRPKKAPESEKDESSNHHHPSNQHGYDDLSLHNHSRSTAATTASSSSQADATAAEELHPSWAARKAQSTGISQFQGKKITFD